MYCVSTSRSSSRGQEEERNGVKKWNNHPRPSLNFLFFLILYWVVHFTQPFYFIWLLEDQRLIELCLLLLTNCNCCLCSLIFWSICFISIDLCCFFIIPTKKCRLGLLRFHLFFLNFNWWNLKWHNNKSDNYNHLS